MKKLKNELLKVNNKVNFLKYKVKKNQKNYSFSIITAVYNGELYLEDYFNSIIKNKYDLQKIQIILVDDGSTDNTKNIIAHWKAKFPNNIMYLSQKNSGQAIARNLGLNYARKEWVTFIDSDDFIEENYFESVNNAINMTDGEAIISTKWINYYEKDNKYLEDHPLSYRFKGKIPYQKRNLMKDVNSFQLAMNSVFFERKKIRRYNLTIQDLKPQFEDALFVFNYMLKTNNYNICFVNNTSYFYRKRSMNNSTLNHSMYDSRRYVELLNEGYLSVMQNYKNKLGYIPQFLQNAILYDLSWNIKELESKKIILTTQQQNLREKYLVKIFNNIKFSNIVNNWKYYWRLYQVGLNNRYYNNEYKEQFGVYYFYETNEYLKLQLLSCEKGWNIKIDEEFFLIEDLDYRIYKENLNQRYFVDKIYLKIPKPFNNLEIFYKEQKVDIVNLQKSPKIEEFNFNSKIIMYDRENKADDNAEIFYEWMKFQHPEYDYLYFAIKKNSPDWDRLSKKGFKLLEYGSEEFEKMYCECDYLISSGFDRKIENYKNFRYNGYKSRAKFIFLQHGIITDDLSEWVSGKRVDKVITSTEVEYNNLKNKYTLFDEEVILTGLPRYDKLYNKPQNEILLQFTWRMKYQDYGIKEFLETDYCKNILRILRNEKFIASLRKYNYKLKFVPHPEINKHLKIFSFCENDVIEVVDIEKISFRDLFATAKLMITDYSSVFTDFAYLKKPVIYYQYDADDFFKTHLYTNELDYRKEGLGKVTTTFEELMEEINVNLMNDCQIKEKYLKRVNKFFKYQDQNNCQRLYLELTKKKVKLVSKLELAHVTITNDYLEGLIGTVELKVDNQIIYKIQVNTPKTKITINNIVFPENLFSKNKEIEMEVLNGVNGRIALETSTEIKLTEQQEQYNKDYDIKKYKYKYGKEIYDIYASIIQKGKPSKMVVTFGGYNHFDANIRYPISYLKELRSRTNNVLFLAFQDLYFTDGTYMLFDNYGRNLRPVIYQFIKKIQMEYHISEENIIFFGSSKGGTIAIEQALKFKNTNVIVNAPQIDLSTFLSKKSYHNDLVLKYLEYNEEANYSIKTQLKKVLKNNKVYYAYSIKDELSNCNVIETLEDPNLIKVKYDCLHREVGFQAWKAEKKYFEKLLNK